MRESKLIGKILGIALVLVMTGTMLGGLVSPASGADQIIAPGKLGNNAPRKLARTSDGVLHCVYSRSDGSYSQIYHSYSTDGGETWTEEPITDAPYRHGNPSIAVDSKDYIHVAWDIRQGSGSSETCAIQYRVKTTTWQDMEDVINQQSLPSLAIDSNDDVHLVIGGKWGGAYSCHYVRYIKRTSSGWGSPETVSSNCWGGNPAIAIDQDNNIHVVYTHSPKSGPLYGLRYRERTASGWQSEEVIQTDDQYWSPCSIALDSSGNIYVVYYLGSYSGVTGVTPGPIMMSTKTSSGWQPAEEVCPASEYWQKNPSISIDSYDYLYVVWQGKHSGSPDYYQMRYRKYTTSWSSVQDLTSASVDQKYPNLIWAWWPVVGDTRTNRPENGYAFVWNDDSDVKFYKSSDLEWETEPVIFEKELKVSFIVDPSPAPYLPLPIEWASAQIIVTYEQYENNKDKFWLREINYEYDGDLVGYSQISLTSSTGEPLPWCVTIGTDYKQKTFYPDITVYSTDKIELYTAGIPALSYEDLLLDVMNPFEIFRRFASWRSVNSMTFDPLDIPKDPYQEYLDEKYGPYIETAYAKMIQIASPGELRVYDSRGNLTGIVEGNIEQGIPGSLCTENRVIIFYANDSYTYEVVGTGEETYGLTVTSIEDGQITTFTATDIPITSGALHQYTVDWNVCSQGEECVTVQVDSDGDGIFERTITSDSELTGDEFIPPSSGCFITTAAYGTPMAKEIEVLRDFRDEYLLTNPVGKALVDFYYKVSPPIAEFINEHPSLKPMVRAWLLPAVAMSTVAVNTTPAEKMAIVGLLMLVSVAVAVWAMRRRGRGPGYS